VPWSKLSLADVDTPANRELARTAARESIVLLKNGTSGFTPLPHRAKHSESGSQILPLNPNIKSIAVVGPTADSLDVLLGNYNGNPSKYTTILAGIRNRYPNAKINYAVGAPLTESRSLPIPPSAFLPRVPGSMQYGNVIPCTDVPIPGLIVQFFSNPRLEGTPVATRRDPNVDFEWNNVSPERGVPAENFSARWCGSLTPPVDGDYRIGVSSDGGSRLYFDDKLLIHDWAPHGDRAVTTLVHLQAGHAYPIKLEYFHHSWESAVRLLWLPPNLLPDAVTAARNSDVVIAVVGITAQLEGEESESSDPGFFGGDRTDITLPASQEQLLEALAATGKPLIVVLTSGSAITVNWANEHAAAILEAWYPGEEGGAAVADVLSGDYNPSGRLPITVYKSVAQLPPFTDYSMFNRTYRYLNEAPLFPFGFGLSYSSFSYSGASLDEHDAAPEARQTVAQPVRAGNNSVPQTQAPEGRHSAPEFPGNTPITLSARVTNTSSVPGDEVVELYVSHPGIDGAPIRSLAGFRRVHLDAHASQTVSFALLPRELSVVDAQGNRSVPAGPVDIWIGGGQPMTLPNVAREVTPKTAPVATNGDALHFTIPTPSPLPN